MLAGAYQAHHLKSCVNDKNGAFGNALPPRETGWGGGLVFKKSLSNSVSLPVCSPSAPIVCHYPGFILLHFINSPLHQKSLVPHSLLRPQPVLRTVQQLVWRSMQLNFCRASSRFDEFSLRSNLSNMKAASRTFLNWHPRGTPM